MKFFYIKKIANKHKHILSATHMKLGPTGDGGRKLASAATANHSDGGGGSAGNIRIREVRKEEGVL